MNLIKIALIGNPNTGKSSIFNKLTGLNQKIANYPGVTVEKRSGICSINKQKHYRIIDLPGIYSLHANAVDEHIATETLINKEHIDHPDVVVFIATVDNLKRNLLLFTQVQDLGFKCILVINMADTMKSLGVKIDTEILEKRIGAPIILSSATKGEGISSIIEAIETLETKPKQEKAPPCIDIQKIYTDNHHKIASSPSEKNKYLAWISMLYSAAFKQQISKNSSLEDEIKKNLHKEAILRYQYISNQLKDVYKKRDFSANHIQSILDKIFIHKFLGYLIFLFVLFLIFQSVYSLSSYPMYLIDSIFEPLKCWVSTSLPSGIFTELLSEGIISGIGAVVIFIPQIALLFLFINLLKQSGYMSRVIYLMDHIMRRFGMSGKSVVPLVSGAACAIPAIMSCRNIENWKDRLLTILVTPFITCSARLPVYIIIIQLVIPDMSFLGFNLKGIVLLIMYLLGFLTSLVFGFILKQFIKYDAKSYLLIEFPMYRIPILKNALIEIYNKTKDFFLNAGKIILIMSIIIWFLGSHGPNKFDNAKQTIVQQYPNLTDEMLNIKLATYKLENSYIGIIGKFIEPAVRPLGYDWKISIALINSFVAREVFVSTLATIYSIEENNESQLLEKMKSEINTTTGKPVFSFATGISLLLFYAFAMQCMSTLAVVQRETNSWKWPILQLVCMTGLAYLVSFIAYQILQ